MDTFKGMASVTVFDGGSYSLWDDLWAGKVPRMAFPELFSFAKIKNISIKKTTTIQDLQQLFRGTCSRSRGHNIQSREGCMVLYLGINAVLILQGI